MRELTIRTAARLVTGTTFGLGLLAAAFACGGSGGGGAEVSGTSPDKGTGQTAAAPAGGSGGLDLANCAGFGVADAATILGTAADGLDARTSQESWGTDCSFFPRGDVMSEQAVSFTLSRSDSADAAAEEMAQLAGHAGVADEVLADQKVSHWVKGVGDEALWAAANGSLYVRSGAYQVIVTRPKEEARQMEVARRLFH